MVTSMRVLRRTGFAGNRLRQTGEVRSRTTLLRRRAHAHTDIINRLLRYIDMLALMTLRLFKHRAVHIQNAVDKIGLVLHAAVSDNAQHTRQLHRRRQVEALADRCIEGVAKAPVLVPNFTFNIFRGH